jgi:hypothetical protein
MKTTLDLLQTGENPGGQGSALGEVVGVCGACNRHAALESAEVGCSGRLGGGRRHNRPAVYRSEVVQTEPWRR